MITFTLHVNSTTFPITWEEFLLTHPKNSIALDGYVKGSTKFFQNSDGTYINFNHHEDVDRLSTRATCAQVLLAIRQGLMDAFHKNSPRNINIYVNDCDQDVCLSVFLLQNYWMAEGVINPLLNKLVHIEDMMDTCAGAYPFPMDMPALREVSWVFEPYTLLRQSGGIERKDDREFESVIESVNRRIIAFITGHAQKIGYNSSYVVVGGGTDWKMVVENGFEARTAMMKDGIHAFVSYRKRDDDKYTYSIGKISMYNQFPVLEIIDRLNYFESEKYNHTPLLDKWGGSNTIGGSPRVGGSMLTPEEVEIIINNFIKDKF